MMPPMPAPFRDTDTAAGLGSAVGRLCAMGFPEAPMRFALEVHSTFEEVVVFLCGRKRWRRFSG